MLFSAALITIVFLLDVEKLRFHKRPRWVESCRSDQAAFGWCANNVCRPSPGTDRRSVAMCFLQRDEANRATAIEQFAIDPGRLDASPVIKSMSMAA